MWKSKKVAAADLQWHIITSGAPGRAKKNHRKFMQYCSNSILNFPCLLNRMVLVFKSLLMKQPQIHNKSFLTCTAQSPQRWQARCSPRPQSAKDRIVSTLHCSQYFWDVRTGFHIWMNIAKHFWLKHRQNCKCCPLSLFIEGSLCLLGLWFLIVRKWRQQITWGHTS